VAGKGKNDEPQGAGPISGGKFYLTKKGLKTKGGGKRGKTDLCNAGGRNENQYTALCPKNKRKRKTGVVGNTAVVEKLGGVVGRVKKGKKKQRTVEKGGKKRTLAVVGRGGGARCWAGNRKTGTKNWGPDKKKATDHPVTNVAGLNARRNQSQKKGKERGGGG